MQLLHFGPLLVVQNHIILLFIVDPPFVTVNQSLYYVQTGNMVTLVCNVSSSLPLTDVQWEKNSNGTITTINTESNTEKYSGSSTNTPSLTIFYAELSDAGIYTQVLVISCDLLFEAVIMSDVQHHDTSLKLILYLKLPNEKYFT
jgi:hypothetical protein